MHESQQDSEVDLEDAKLDFSLMPDYVKNDIAAAAWGAVQRFMKRPDAREILDNERKRLESEGSTLLKPISKKEART